MAYSEQTETTPFSLFDACVYNANLNEKDYFVGIKYENDSLRVNFPLGYKKAATEEELKKRCAELNRRSVFPKLCKRIIYSKTKGYSQ